ncbi:unnamed protein product [Peronospora destructor]|uniref:Uncharacterized protein n=1 Tax=Peronospora destructor TaxID=86335 RepID=A0AAV0UEU2_9STRA|nr:unnamed protein product [Peronospora destructor]
MKGTHCSAEVSWTMQFLLILNALNWTQTTQCAFQTEQQPTWSSAAIQFLKQFDLAIIDYTKAIKVAPMIKPFMRRATAYIALQQFRQAVADLEAALEFEPRNKECHAKLQAIVDTATDVRQRAVASPELREAAIQAALIVSVGEGWTKSAVRGNPGPAAVNGHTLFLGADGRIYLFGGRALNDERMNDVWTFDVKKQLWTLLQCFGDIPPPMSYHTAHTIGEFLFVVGGRTAESEDNTVYMLDIGTCEWFKVPVPDDHDLTPRAWHSSVVTDGGKLFVLGGGSYHGPLKDTALLDLDYFQSKASLLFHRHDDKFSLDN